MIVAIALALLVKTQHPQRKPVDHVDCPTKVVMPMLETKRQAPLIELEIGGAKYKFMLDTGAVGGRISNAIVKKLHLDPIGIIQTGDPSGKNTQQASVYRIPQIKAGGATLYGVEMFASDGLIAGEADGVIGYAVFQSLLLTLDYPKREVTLTPGGMTADQAKTAIKYTRDDHGLIQLPVQIGDVKVSGHVDSGSDGGLSVPTKYKAQLHLDGEPKLVGHAKTLFNSFDIYLAKVKDPILVGGMKMPIDQVELQDLLPFANIGGRLLKKFKVTIDQKDKRILFE